MNLSRDVRPPSPERSQLGPPPRVGLPLAGKREPYYQLYHYVLSLSWSHAKSAEICRRQQNPRPPRRPMVRPGDFIRHPFVVNDHRSVDAVARLDCALSRLRWRDFLQAPSDAHRRGFASAMAISSRAPERETTGRFQCALCQFRAPTMAMALPVAVMCLSASSQTTLTVRSAVWRAAVFMFG